MTTWIALFPIAVALAGWIGGAASGLSFSGWKLHGAGDVITVAVYAVALVYYVVGLMPRAFRRKREYLQSYGLYGREQAVFEALQRRAPKERPLDYILYAIGAGVLALFGPLVGLVAALPFVDDVDDVPALMFLAGYVPGFALVAVLWKRWPRAT